MDNLAHHWMVRQQQAGLRLCLVLDGTNEACQSLLAVRSVSQYCRFYAQTSLADLAAEGPVVLLLDHVGEPALLSLLRTPQMNWGWLGSVASAELSNLAQHWRDRLLVGPQGIRRCTAFMTTAPLRGPSTIWRRSSGRHTSVH